jgi:glycosyltransferase involved in cell wall biosynthesis
MTAAAAARPLRIAVVTEVDLSQPYGHTVHLTEIWSRVASAGHDVTVFVPRVGVAVGVAPSDPGHAGARGFPFRVAAIPLPPVPKIGLALYELRLALELIRRHRKSRWDLVYTRSDLYSIGGWLAARLLRRPHVTELNAIKRTELLHEGKPGHVAWIADRFERWITAHSERVVAVTEGLARRASRLHHVFPETFAVVANGVNTERFRPPEEGRVFRADGMDVVFAGQLTTYQGLLTLLDAAGLLEKSIRFTIIGGGPMEEDLRRLAERMNVSEAIRFTGPLPPGELAGRLHGFDVAVAPYTEARNIEIEISPVKVHTYLAAGLPVVASRLPGLEFLESEGVGVLIPPDNPKALAKTLGELLKDVERRSQMSLRARRLAVERLDWNDRAKELMEVLRSVAVR